MKQGKNLVFLGLSLSSAWGNGHATTFRALIKGLARAGHKVTFLERDVPWYAENRDLAAPDYCRLILYDDPSELNGRLAGVIAGANVVIVGSYVPDGVDVLDTVLALAPGPIAFYDIDTPVTLAGLEKGDTDFLARRQIPQLDLYLSFAGGPSLDRLRSHYGAREARALYCMVDPELYAPTGEAPAWDLGYLGTYSADRQEALERLLLEPARRLSDRRFVVAGPQYPENIDWPDNVDRINHVPPAEHSSFYSRLRFALNLTRADMRAAGWSPSVRLFEAAACETAILSDHWEGLDSFFPAGEALIAAHSPDDVVAVLCDLDSAKVEAMGRSARRAALTHHTGDVRASELIDALAGLRRVRGATGRPRRHGAGNGSRAATLRPASAPAALVAGGAGFLGSHLCDRLIADGWHVFCVDSFYTGRRENIDHLARHPRFTLLEHDVREGHADLPAVAEVYNLACPASPPHYQKDPVHTMTTSVVGTLSLLEFAASAGARFIMASTSEVYGDPEVHPQPESYCGSVNPLGPRACYDEGKRAAEALCYDFIRERRADVRVARIFNTYGPRMAPDDGRIVSNLVIQALSGRPLTIYGSGEQTRSFCYVNDLIEGLLRLARLAEAPPTPVNLGNPEEFTVRELADLVCQLSGANGPLVHRPLPQDDPQRRRPDISLARELLDWQPEIPLRKGLGATIEWFAGHERSSSVGRGGAAALANELRPVADSA